MDGQHAHPLRSCPVSFAPAAGPVPTPAPAPARPRRPSSPFPVLAAADDHLNLPRARPFPAARRACQGPVPPLRNHPADFYTPQQQYHDQPAVPAPVPHLPLPEGRAPLYGETRVDKQGYVDYRRSGRFDEWLNSARDSSTPEDEAWAAWLAQKGNEDKLKEARKQALAAEAKGEREGNAPETTGTPRTTAGRRARLLDSVNRRISVLSNDSDGNRRGRRTSAFEILAGLASPGTSSRASSHNPKKIRIALIGDRRCGKTSMINYLYTGMYMGDTEPSTVTRANEFPIPVGPADVALEAWDIPGGSIDCETHPLNMAFFHAVFICFSIESQKNLASVHRWIAKLQSCMVEAPIFLVGCKRDTRPSFPSLRLAFIDDDDAPCSRAQCEKVAMKVKAEDYFETSALNGEGILEAFNLAIDHCLTAKEREEKKRAKRMRREKFKKNFVAAGQHVQNAGRKVQHVGRRGYESVQDMFCLRGGAAVTEHPDVKVFMKWTDDREVQ